MGRFRWLFLLVALFGCFGSPTRTSAQQNQLGRIVGNVRVVKGDFPAHPVLISLAMRGSPIASAYCDDQGRFGFYSLVANEYEVSINDDGYEPVSATANVNPNTSPMNFVELKLIPRPSAQKDPIPGRVPGSNPYLVDPAEFYRKFPKQTVKEFEKGVEADHKGRVTRLLRTTRRLLATHRTFIPLITTWDRCIWLGRISTQPNRNLKLH
jgi:hypothetical protein